MDRWLEDGVSVSFLRDGTGVVVEWYDEASEKEYSFLVTCEQVASLLAFSFTE